MQIAIRFTAAAAVLVLSTSLAAADEVRLNGATTAIDRFVNPSKAAVEKATGHTLTIVGNATGRGLADLVDGKCDASLASEPLDIAAEAAKAAGHDVDPGKLKLHVVRYDEIVFVVHKNNPVKKLSWQQIRDIHTGKIGNWKEVGGKDLPITVYSDALTGGTRAMIKYVVLEGKDYGATVKPQANVKKVGEMVALAEDSIGGIGKGFADTDKVSIIETKKIERPLGIITLGAPSAPVAKVIAAFQAEAKN